MLFKEIVDARTDARTHARTTDDGHRTLKDHKSSLEHFVLRWAKKQWQLIQQIISRKVYTEVFYSEKNNPFYITLDQKDDLRKHGLVQKSEDRKWELGTTTDKGKGPAILAISSGCTNLIKEDICVGHIRINALCAYQSNKD